MKVGFHLNTSSKRKKILNNEYTDNHDREGPIRQTLTGIEKGEHIIDKTNKEEKELVIPLPPGPRGCIDKSSNKGEGPSIDDIAAQELLDDMYNTSKGNTGPQLVIGGDTEKKNVKAPLLMANLAPELIGIGDDDERFKVDISLRAENMDVTSDAYQAVPIEQFGAAMLRGMGWSGPAPEDEENKRSYDVVPREHRLGLGATPKPPDEKDKRGGRDKKKEREKEKQEWRRKAEERLGKQKLYEGDLVWLRAPAALAGCRGEVTATAGVPGLNRIRITLEKDGTSVDVDRKDAVLLTGEDLEEKPYRRAVVASAPAIPKQAEEQTKSRKRSREPADKDNRSSHKRDKRDRSHERSKEVVSHRVDGRSSRDEGSSSKPWVRAGIRVRVVSKRASTDPSHYLKKGAVLDVYRSSSGSVLASLQLDNGDYLQNIKEKHLETVLPSVGETCVVLSGMHVGETAVLLEKKHKVDSVVLQLTEDMSEIVTVPMDDIAAPASL